MPLSHPPNNASTCKEKEEEKKKVMTYSPSLNEALDNIIKSSHMKIIIPHAYAHLL